MKYFTDDRRRNLEAGHEAVPPDLDERTWELNDRELDDVALFIDDMRRGRNCRHEPWCDPEQHELAAEGRRLEYSP